MPRAPRHPMTGRQQRLEAQQLPLSNPYATTGNSITDADADLNDEFLSELAHEESWRSRPRAQMTDEEHAAFLERATNVPSVARHWCKGTKRNVFTMDRKWKAYCERYNLGDPELALPTTDRARAMSFLTFMCANYDINTTDTLWQYFRTWKQPYHHIVGKEFCA
ncbi:hypothetical protein BJY52DRAFT_1193080 [Lactarius psammicola]|nr:hypothetical protein BJY52DRAFT_1193080 [Lactarius psammicola]